MDSPVSHYNDSDKCMYSIQMYMTTGGNHIHNT